MEKCIFDNFATRQCIRAKDSNGCKQETKYSLQNFSMLHSLTNHSLFNALQFQNASMNIMMMLPVQ